MNFAAIDWLSISINLLLVVFVIVCLLMCLLILMQRPKQEGLGAAFGAGVTDQVFGARTTDVLQRGTVYLGSLFFVLALTLAVLIGHQNKSKSLIPDKKATQSEPAKTEDKPKEEVAPKSLSEELPAEESPAGTTPDKNAAPTENTTPPLPAPEPAPADGDKPSEPAPADTQPAAPADADKPADAGASGSTEEKSGQP